MAALRIAFVVGTPAERGDGKRVLALVQAADDMDVETSAFFMSDGLTLLTDDVLRNALLDTGCEIACCAESALARGLTDLDLGGIPLGTQDDHAQMVSRADKVVAFT